MSIMHLLSLSVILTLDGFLISLPFGINKKIPFSHKVYLPLLFFIFAMSFSILGASLSSVFVGDVDLIPQVLGGLVLMYLGFKMIKEGRSLKKDDAVITTKPLTLVMALVYTISGSMDSFVVGFSQTGFAPTFAMTIVHSLFIGIVAAILSFLGLLIGDKLSNLKIVEEYADELGGVILIGFGMVTLLGM